MLRPGTTFIPAQAVMIVDERTPEPVYSVEELDTLAGMGLGRLIDTYA